MQEAVTDDMIMDLGDFNERRQLQVELGDSPNFESWTFQQLVKRINDDRSKQGTPAYVPDPTNYLRLGSIQVQRPRPATQAAQDPAQATHAEHRRDEPPGTTAAPKAPAPMCPVQDPPRTIQEPPTPAVQVQDTQATQWMQQTHVTQEVQQPVTPKVEAKEEIHEPELPAEEVHQEQDTQETHMYFEDEGDLPHLELPGRFRRHREAFLANMPPGTWKDCTRQKVFVHGT